MTTKERVQMSATSKTGIIVAKPQSGKTVSFSGMLRDNKTFVPTCKLE